MLRDLYRFVAAGIVAAALCLSTGTAQVAAQAKKPEPPPKPDPLVIKLQSAQKGKLNGQDVLMVTGIEPLSGKQRSFAVENQKPQNPNSPMKYDPDPRVKSEVDKVKPGEYLKIEPKGQQRNGSGGAYGRPAAGGVEWIDKAEPYTLAEHEEEPNTFLFDGSFEEEMEGTKVYTIELVKMGRSFKCLAPMIKDGKSLVPDPAIVAAGEEIMKKEKEKDKKAPKTLIEASINPSGKFFFVTALDEYQAPRTATLTKMTEAEVEGAKVPAVELSENGTATTLVIAGKLVGKRWVTDSALLSAAKRLKPGSPVVFKTRSADQKQYLRSIAPAPKESPKKEKDKDSLEMKK